MSEDAVHLTEEQVFEACEKVKRGEFVSISEMSAVTGYDLGWRDGWNDRRSTPTPEEKA